MSTKQSRRRFLNATAYVSALSVTGLSTLALANDSKAMDEITAKSLIDNNTLNNSEIKIVQETHIDREKVTLINQSGKLQMLDARRPISLHQVDGALVVTVNQNSEDAVNGMVLMSPNERFTFDVSVLGIEVDSKIINASDLPILTNLSENKLRISSENSVFNRIVAVKVV